MTADPAPAVAPGAIAALRRSLRPKLVQALCLALAAALPAGGQERDSTVLPAVAHEALEPAVAEQITALESHVRAVLEGDAAAAEKGDAVGELGRLYHAYELLGPAEECYRRAASLAPRDFRWRYHLGYLLQSAGRLEEAVGEYERALGIHGRVPPALVRLGQVYLELDQTEAAEEVLRRALTLDPASAAAHAVLGEVLLAQDRHAEAIERLELALDYTPDANRLFYPLALAYRGLGQEDKARELMARRGAVGIRPADPLIDGLVELTTGERVSLLRGRAAFGAGRFAEAAEEFRKAVTANPESIPARVNLGSALAQIGDAAGAIAEYRTALELGPGNVTARFNLGMLLAGQGRVEEAVSELRAAVQYGPKDAEAHYQLAAGLRRLGRPEDALTHYVLASELAPPGEKARLGRAATLVDLARYGEARRVLEEALSVIPSSGLLAASLARLLAACPDPAIRDGERALELARKAYRGRPVPAHAELIAEALAETGRCEEAAELQQGLIEKLGAVATPSTSTRLETAMARYRAGPPCRPPSTLPGFETSQSG